MPASAEGLAVVARVNLCLETVAKGETGRQTRNVTSPERMPAQYKIEFVQDLSQWDTARSTHCGYCLRVTRREKAGNHTSTKRALSVISEYMVTVDGLHTASRISTYLAPTGTGNNGHYLYKGFAKLLVHLLVYCCACARVRINVYAVHPATTKVYAKYAEDAYDSCCIRPCSAGATGNVTDFCIDASAGGLSDAGLGGLKESAMLRIDSVLRAIIASRHTTPRANMYTVPGSVE